jgi:putative DNA primase/helicase
MNNEDLEFILEAAKVYHELGIPVIPFSIYPKEDESGEYDKAPIIETWKQWETQPQTDEEFNALNWTNANAIGVLLGTQTKYGYLSCIDYDVKGKTVSEDAKKKGLEITNDFPVTKKEETVNKGLHLFFWSTVEPKTDGTFHDTAAVELLGEKKLMVVYPSYGYANLSSDVISSVQDINQLFLSILRKHGFGKSEETELEQQQDRYSLQLSQLVDLSKLKQISPNEYQGSHPIHDSTTEKNFTVNVKDNTWYCFRHSSGGGALMYLAMKEGLIKCEEAQKGRLRGKKFKEVLNIAVSQGLLDEKILSQSEINPVFLAKDIMQDYDFCTDKDSNTLYYYDKDSGVWNIRTEQLLKREIAKRLDENFKTSYYIQISEFLTAIAPLVDMDVGNPDIIAVNNGLLNPLNGELTPFSKNIYITNKLPIKYEPQQKYDEWTDYIASILEPVYYEQVQEFIGHLLIKRIIDDAGAICNGSGANGKSVFLDIIILFLGPENVSNHTLQNLCYEKFVTKEVKGKLANICADLPSKEIQTAGIYKMITSGDRVSGYIKHVQNPIYFKPYAKYLYSANSIPNISSDEDNYAWYRRFLIWDFKKTFTKENMIPRSKLIEKYTTEKALSGLLNYAIEGLKRLNNNHGYSDRPDVPTVRRAWIERANSCLAYIEDSLKVTDNAEDFIIMDELYRAYVTYCHNRKMKSKSKGELTKTIEQYVKGAEHIRIRAKKGENPVSAWRYLRFVSSVSNVSALDSLLAKEKNLSGKKIPSGHKSANTDTADTADTETATTCPICHGLLPEDHYDTTILDGKEVHMHCYNDVILGRKEVSENE